jgi:hypothetical protein
MQEKRKTAATPAEIEDFLKQTGFVFEMRMHEALLKSGYACEISSTFYDLEGNTEREIDIVASKVVNDITVHFIFECKQSLLDKWIFICNKDDSGRFYYAVKHRPSIEVKVLQDTKLFSHFHTFSPKIPLAHNYICYSIVTGKKTDHLQIGECIHKLPKATVDVASHGEAGRHLFFPVGLFSGQLFTVKYSGSLVVEERPFVQFFVRFKSDAYKDKFSYELLGARTGGTFDFEESRKRSEEERIQKTARKLAPPYQIDFVTEAGLAEYLDIVEKEVAAVKIDAWVLPTPPAEPQPA